MSIRQTIQRLAHTLLISLSFLVLSAQASPAVSIAVMAEKEIVELDDQGREILRRVTAQDAEPGDVIFYTINYQNDGSSSARDIVLDNPVPEGTRLVDDSAWGDQAEIQLPTVNAEEDQAQVVRWLISEIPAGTDGAVGFSVVVL
ncbi:DUF11 domain-containing protein [Isoalcanivorax indicus]|uniref:DUF11 domain-containing protein n=1 Tax=Isoalcanivorax indicus TaxID=2202653 RepID=UPI000DB984D8|nr:DUF11 domain-containing protein [Isoalcanivorax indicus]